MGRSGRRGIVRDDGEGAPGGEAMGNDAHQRDALGDDGDECDPTMEV